MQCTFYQKKMQKKKMERFFKGFSQIISHKTETSVVHKTSSGFFKRRFFPPYNGKPHLTTDKQNMRYLTCQCENNVLNYTAKTNP